MAYRIVLKRSAAKELADLPSRSHDTIIKHLRDLESNPRKPGVEKLTGIDAYKLRVGNYRVVFEIDEAAKEVNIVMVDDRKQVYQRLRRKK
jgi:mRNA interferase RelE/StbE